jgi:hypothetical protein
MLVAFGSEDGASRTWTFDGAWHTFASDQPSFRTGAALVYDPERKRTIMFGGAVTQESCRSTGMTETLTFDGTRWAVLDSAEKPAPRLNHAMVWDPSRKEVVLIGGDCERTPGDVWRLGAGGWTRPAIPAMTGPSFDAGSFPQVVYDGDRQRIVVVDDDTWALEDASWTRLGGAPSVEGGGLVWDAARHRLMLTSGTVGTSIIDASWTFDGSNWVGIAGAAPGDSLGGMAATRDASGDLVFFGGTHITLVAGGVQRTASTDRTLLFKDRWSEPARGISPGDRANGSLAAPTIRWPIRSCSSPTPGPSMEPRGVK